MLTGRKARERFQAVNIRGIPTRLVVRWRRALVRDGISIQDWFILRAAETADNSERKPA